MTPAYIRHELDASLANLGLDTIDVYYVHNPETQLQEVSREVFLGRLKDAFEALEGAVAEGKIRSYGTATWNGYRMSPGEGEYLSLEEVLGAARAAGGEDHHFRVVQLPLNLGMPEAFSKPNQTINGETTCFLAAAAKRGITVMTSGSILQGRAAQGLPPVIGEVFPGFFDRRAARAPVHPPARPAWPSPWWGCARPPTSPRTWKSPSPRPRLSMISSACSARSEGGSSGRRGEGFAGGGHAGPRTGPYACPATKGRAVLFVIPAKAGIHFDFLLFGWIDTRANTK